MKRIIFAVVLLVFLIIFNTTCFFTISSIKTESIEKLDSIYENIANGNYEKTAYECRSFNEYWLSGHHVLNLIVRHDLLDQTSASVAKLVPLSEFGEWGILASEVLRCKVTIEEIWDSERPLLRNIL